VITKEMISSCLIGVQCRYSDDFRELSVKVNVSYDNNEERKRERL